MYTAFASVYDRLMRDVDYAAWAAHYIRLLQARGIPNGRVCECACGTGSLTLPLQKAGYTMTGVDASADMLSVAAEKALGAGLRVPFVRQDMRKLSLHRAQDAVLCTCDGINYLTTPAQCLQFFKAAYGVLRKGGVFAFDLSSPEKLRNILSGNTLTLCEEDAAYIWQNAWNEKTGIASMLVNVFAKNADGSYTRIVESQRQRAHSQDEITGWLKQAGFVRVRFYGAMRLSAPRQGDQRWHVTAEKISD